MAQVIPDAEVVDVGASKHKVQLERHRAVNRAIERFVEDGERKASWRVTDGPTDVPLGRPWIKLYSKNTPATVPIPDRPLSDLLEQAAEGAGKRTATVFYGQRLTYVRLNQQANQIGQILHGWGVQPGQRVLLLLPNMPELIAAYYGMLKIGAVAVLSPPDATTNDVIRQARETDAVAVVTLRSLAGLAAELRQAAGIRDVLLADLPADAATHEQQMVARLAWPQPEDQDPDSASPLRGGRLLRELIKDAPFEPPRASVRSDDLAVITYTSGATGPAKGVCLTHANLMANTLQLRHWIADLRYGQEVFLTALPLTHSYGMTVGMNLPIAVGATMLLLPDFTLNQVLHNIWSYHPTFFPGVPSMFSALTQAPNIRSYGIGSIRACICGAAPLPVEVQEAFEKLTQARLVEGYGLTEASPVTHADLPERGHAGGSIGVPLPNTDARIVDAASGRDLLAGQIGELMVKGPQVMAGYLGGRANGPDSRGWLATGDLAVMDADGLFRIIGRKVDVIVRDGQTVYPRDVEEALHEHSKVLETAVVGCEEGGPVRIVGFVVLERGAAVSAEEMLEHCRRRLDVAAVPDAIEFRQKLPRNAVGQVLYRELRAHQRAGVSDDD